MSDAQYESGYGGLPGVATDSMLLGDLGKLGEQRFCDWFWNQLERKVVSANGKLKHSENIGAQLKFAYSNMLTFDSGIIFKENKQDASDYM